MAEPGKIKGPWLRIGIASVLSCGVIGLGLRLFRLTPSSPSMGPAQKMEAVRKEVPKPFVGIAGLDSVENPDLALKEKAEFFDPLPLFLPTPWNYEQGPLSPGLERRPSEIFGRFAAKMTFPEAKLDMQFGPRVSLPESPKEVLTGEDRDPFFSFGREDGPLPVFQTRGAFVEVSGMGANATTVRQELKEAHPPREDWAPVEYMAAVDETGLLGQLVVSGHDGLPGDGADEVDAYFRDFLSKNFRLGSRLSPGIYRVLVGP